MNPRQRAAVVPTLTSKRSTPHRVKFLEPPNSSILPPSGWTVVSGPPHQVAPGGSNALAEIARLDLARYLQTKEQLSGHQMDLAEVPEAKVSMPNVWAGMGVIFNSVPFRNK